MHHKRKRAKRQRARKTAPLLPPIIVGFEEAVTRILKVKPEPRQTKKAKRG